MSCVCENLNAVPKLIFSHSYFHNQIVGQRKKQVAYIKPFPYGGNEA